MNSLISTAIASARNDWKAFWDNIVKPEIKVIDAALENLQKELAPIEESALKAIAGAGIAACAVASGGVMPTTLAAALPILEVGASAAMAQAEKQGVSLSAHAALALVASAGVPLPVVANGANP